jgi:hypothetical protein
MDVFKKIYIGIDVLSRYGFLIECLRSIFLNIDPMNKENECVVLL